MDIYIYIYMGAAVFGNRPASELPRALPRSFREASALQRLAKEAVFQLPRYLPRSFREASASTCWHMASANPSAKLPRSFRPHGFSIQMNSTCSCLWPVFKKIVYMVFLNDGQIF